MREERLLSVGIDIGTSTTQCVFSALTLTNTASSFSVPRVSITRKEVIWRAPVRLTPLADADTIDAQALEAMIRRDYRDAGITPADIRLGAVIITGETARKKNARAVTQALSGMAGDFVVATAGPSLESILAGKGSGAAQMSKTGGKPVLNLDIGGGTANMALFLRGEPAGDGCLDIGGRLIRFEGDDETVLSFTQAAALISKDAGVPLTRGMRLSPAQAKAIARRMAEVLEEAAGFSPRTALHEALTVGHSLPLPCEAGLFTFSGGVADCVYGGCDDALSFHDFGRYLGQAIAGSMFFTRGRVLRPDETGHATVIGAGAYSVTVSGSTICCQAMTFPLPSLPAGKVLLNRKEHLEGLEAAIGEQYRMYEGECAICFEGIHSPSFDFIESAAERIARAMAPFPLKVLILREDMAKALGQALSRRWGRSTPFLCIDGIALDYGDTVDIGMPLSEGRVIPVIVKTLAFAREAGR